ncbi:MAG: right-handed parallel beta-helix repeat-containing protein, partial [bacterium]|nr:right-handed parallel beta-helix repeat-containing protein [bacterium]
YPYLPDHHGVVILANCDITKAHIGVLTDNLANNGHETYWQPYGTWGKDYGGIVYALKSNFTDNKRAAHIAAFPANLTGAPPNAPNISRFIDCVIDDPANVSTQGISVWGSQNVIFDNTNFLDIIGYSLSFDDATGRVYECEFKDFVYGIRIDNTAGHTTGFQTIIGDENDASKGNLFEFATLGASRPIGIWADNAVKLQVHNNQFNSTYNPIFIAGPSQYTVTQNTFDNFIWGNILQNTFDNLSEADYNCNHYDDLGLTRGVYVWGNNGNFLFEKETFNIPSGQDMLLANSGATLGEINGAQGGLGDPVLNLFSGTQHIISPAPQTNSFTYFHPGSNLTTAFPTLTFIPDNTGQNFVNIGYTLSFADYDDGCLELEGVGDRPREGECKTEECLDSLNNLLADKRSFIDGGDTGELVNALLQSPAVPDTYGALSGAAPYLSNEVLLTMLSVDMELSQKEAILLQNAPVSASVLSAAQSLITDDTYHALLDIRASEGYSAMEVLIAEISGLESKKAKAFNHIYSTAFIEGDWATAESLLIEEGSFSSMRKLVGLKLRMGEFDEADAYVQAMTTENDEESTIADLLALEVAYRSNPVDYSLSGGDEAYLQLLSQDTLSSTYTFSRALLRLITGAQFAPPVPPDSPIDGLVQQQPGWAVPQSHKSLEETISILPNPAQDIATAILPVNAEPDWRVELWSSTGAIIQSHDINSNQVDFNLEGLPAGFYVVRAINKVEPLQIQQSLIIQ